MIGPVSYSAASRQPSVILPPGYAGPVVFRFVPPGLWAGLVRTAAHMTSGWHHHADYETSIYVVSGRLRMESGSGGTEVVEARAGDFLRVPKGAIHRESNPGDEESHIVVVRAGSGPAVVNVDGPAGA